VIAPASVALPVREGQRLGRVELWDGSRLVASANLVAAAAVSEPGSIAKVAWYVRRTGQKFWELFT
jgi:hypothetical protein